MYTNSQKLEKQPISPVGALSKASIDKTSMSAGPISIAPRWPGHSSGTTAWLPLNQPMTAVAPSRCPVPRSRICVFVVDSPIGSVNVPSAGPITGIGVRGRLCLTSEPAVIRRT